MNKASKAIKRKIKKRWEHESFYTCCKKIWGTTKSKWKSYRGKKLEKYRWKLRLKIESVPTSVNENSEKVFDLIKSLCKR